MYLTYNSGQRVLQLCFLRPRSEEDDMKGRPWAVSLSLIAFIAIPALGFGQPNPPARLDRRWAR